jgi:hypothetical protein
VAATPGWRWATRAAQDQQPLLVSGLLIVAIAAGANACRLRFWDLAVPGPGDSVAAISYPAGVVDYLREQDFTGNVMVPFEAGAFVSWKLYPRVRVSIDSRYEAAYPEELVARIGRFYDAAEDWKSTLADYPTDLVIVPLAKNLAGRMAESGWRRVYTDRGFLLYAKPSLRMPAVDRTDQALRGWFP